MADLATSIVVHLDGYPRSFILSSQATGESIYLRAIHGPVIVDVLYLQCAHNPASPTGFWHTVGLQGEGKHRVEGHGPTLREALNRALHAWQFPDPHEGGC